MTIEIGKAIEEAGRELAGELGLSPAGWGAPAEGSRGLSDAGNKTNERIESLKRELRKRIIKDGPIFSERYGHLDSTPRRYGYGWDLNGLYDSDPGAFFRLLEL